MAARQAAFRRAADLVAQAFANFPAVQAIALFGSVARPLGREVPRFQPFRRLGIEILHECKDVDLAVWIDRLDGLRDLGRARSAAVAERPGRPLLGVAHHQVDVFLFEPGTNRYLGRLCTFAQCPKGKVECMTPGCGREPFLKQHQDFVIESDALAEHRIVHLYRRGAGILRRAADLPLSGPPDGPDGGLGSQAA